MATPLHRETVASPVPNASDFVELYSFERPGPALPVGQFLEEMRALVRQHRFEDGLTTALRYGSASRDAIRRWVKEYYQFIRWDAQGTAATIARCRRRGLFIACSPLVSRKTGHHQVTRPALELFLRFPGKYSLALGVLTHHFPVKDLLDEWRAQIQRCRDTGVEIRFLNTHEHLHALPPLFTAILELTREYNIPYLRCPEPEWDGWSGFESVVRNTFLQGMHLINRRRVPKETPKLLGMNPSGKLTLSYLRKSLGLCQRGQVHELMCHPGYFDPKEIRNPRLCSYHHWQQELDLLQ